MTLEKKTEIKPIWTVVANIVSERKVGPNGTETKYGTKAFRPNTKVYVIGLESGTCETIIVVGIARKSRKFVTMRIRANWIENLRVKLAYNPVVIKKAEEFYGKEKINLTEEFANKMYDIIPLWQTQLNK